MSKESLIFDRNEDDLLNNTSKAYLNYTDLNRITEETSEIKKAIRSQGYYVVVETLPVWYKAIASTDKSNVPTLEIMNTLYSNIKNLINGFHVYSTTPAMPKNIEKLTIYNVNDIEKILYDMHIIKDSINDTMIYCGTIECGG